MVNFIVSTHIAEQRLTENRGVEPIGQVGADLMLESGLRLNFHQSDSVIGIQNFVLKKKRNGNILSDEKTELGEA